MSQASEISEPRPRKPEQPEFPGLLVQVAERGAGLPRFFAAHPPPELDTLFNLYGSLVMDLGLKAVRSPAKLSLMKDLLRPLLEWAAVQEKRKLRELAERKYRDAIDARQKAQAGAPGGLKPETLQQIEQELNLF